MRRISQRSAFFKYFLNGKRTQAKNHLAEKTEIVHIVPFASALGPVCLFSVTSKRVSIYFHSTMCINLSGQGQFYKFSCIFNGRIKKDSSKNISKSNQEHETRVWPNAIAPLKMGRMEIGCLLHE